MGPISVRTVHYMMMVNPVPVPGDGARRVVQVFQIVQPPSSAALGVQLVRDQGVVNLRVVVMIVQTVIIPTHASLILLLLQFQLIYGLGVLFAPLFQTVVLLLQALDLVLRVV